MLLLIPAVLFAQNTGTNLSGRVADESGAALPGVTVTATNDATGFNRSTVTGPDGSYRFLSLPIGTYSVVADLSGFANVTTKDVQLQVATDRTLNITLKQAAVKEQITVTAEAPLVATSPSVGTVVSQKELENLPLNGRQFANLGALAPGTTLSTNSDPTKPGQLTIALNGGSGRNVNFLVDGGDNTDDTIGGALQNFNIEAVQEFKIQTMQYKAEYGRSSGGVLSVVTKTGTNDFQGSAYEFYRAKSLNAISHSEDLNGGEKLPYRRDQYGASFGGPLVKDRVHFFGTYEKTKRNTTYSVNTPLLPAFDGLAIGLPFTDQLATAKVSGDLTPKQFLQVRYGFQKNTDKYGASSLAAPSSLGTTTNKYSSLLAGHTWQVASDKLNEFLVQRTKFDNLISADSNDPYIYYPSGAHQGQSVNTPQSTHQMKRQFKDDFSWSNDMFKTRNDWKIGLNYVDEPTLSGDFTVGTTGQFTLLKDQVGSPVENILFNGGFSGVSTPIKYHDAYIQDDIGVNSRLTINAGLRYDLWTGYDLDQSLNSNLALVQQFADAGKYTESYIQDFKNGGGTKLSNDRNNWSPRLGFTYDLSGNAKQIIRGGVGRYYDFPYTNATILFPASAVQSLFGPVYGYEDPNGIKNANGTFFQPGQPLPPNQLSGKLTDRTTRELASPTLRAPYSDQASLGYSTEISSNLGMNFEVVSARYHDIPFRFRANPIDPATGKRRFSAVAPANFRLWYGKGHAQYDGVNIGFHSRMGEKFEAQGFYTYSKSRGNILAGADEFRVTDAGFQPDTLRDGSVNPLDPDCSACNGPLDTDARHRVTLSGVYRAPLGINVSGIIRYRSALPYTVFAGTDLNHDGYNQDLAPGHAHVNDARGASFSQADFRLSKEFRFSGRYGIEAIAEVFNLFNSKNSTVFDSTGTPHAFAGDPGQGEQRLMQLGARVRF
ncbi:MAG TPA: TonB-dependent receptor [Thermoanaerobaculia bacterium]|nr:TonB-dependent receptor [Thermoanaerobaculia bacterium]